jgi:amino acid transporter
VEEHVTQYATDLSRTRSRRSARAIAVLALGPLAMLAGVVWAFVQPWRMTLLHPHGQGFWWLVVEPPLLVVAAGVLFAFLAHGIVHDLEHAEEDR